MARPAVVAGDPRPGQRQSRLQRLGVDLWHCHSRQLPSRRRRTLGAPVPPPGRLLPARPLRRRHAQPEAPEAAFFQDRMLDRGDDEALQPVRSSPSVCARRSPRMRPAFGATGPSALPSAVNSRQSTIIYCCSPFRDTDHNGEGLPDLARCCQERHFLCFPPIKVNAKLVVPNNHLSNYDRRLSPLEYSQSTPLRRRDRR